MASGISDTINTLLFQVHVSFNAIMFREWKKMAFLSKSWFK